MKMTTTKKKRTHHGDTDDEDEANKKIFKREEHETDDTRIEIDDIRLNVLAENYNMQHRKRGRAIIFNHVFCHGHSAPRKGTETDVSRLVTCLTEYLHFQVIVYTDLTHEEILDTLRRLSKERFEDEDCLAVFVLTHGSLHKLTAKDVTYPVDELWQFFTPDKCVSLAGKPKLFFINSCRGKKFDEGVLYTHENIAGASATFEDSSSVYTTYRIPIYADFLTFYSTMEGYISVRHAIDGTWFIQSLCETIENRNYRRLELKQILTIVARKTALKCNAYGEIVTQIPTIMSTLIRNVYFF